jgi:hypothetical protein
VRLYPPSWTNAIRPSHTSAAVSSMRRVSFWKPPLVTICRANGSRMLASQPERG